MQLLMYSPKLITITREITYQQSICECCGQYEYDEHEGILFMKKTIVGELFLNFLQVFMAAVVGMFTDIHTCVGHLCQSAVIHVHTHTITIPFHVMCCPMSDVSSVCI